MTKHIHVLTIVLSLTSLLSSVIFGEDLFTILGWFTATMASLSTLLYFTITENNKKG